MAHVVRGGAGCLTLLPSFHDIFSVGLVSDVDHRTIKTHGSGKRATAWMGGDTTYVVSDFHGKDPHGEEGAL